MRPRVDALIDDIKAMLKQLDNWKIDEVLEVGFRLWKIARDILQQAVKR